MDILPFLVIHGREKLPSSVIFHAPQYVRIGGEGKILESFGDRFRRNLIARRHALGLTQKEVAELYGTETPKINRWEKGHREPGFDEIERLSKALKCEPAFFFGEGVAEAITATPLQALEILSSFVRNAVSEKHGGNQKQPSGHIPGEKADHKKDKAITLVARKGGGETTKKQHHAEHAGVDKKLIHDDASENAADNLMAQPPLPGSPELLEELYSVIRTHPDVLEKIVESARIMARVSSREKPRKRNDVG